MQPTVDTFRMQPTVDTFCMQPTVDTFRMQLTVDTFYMQPTVDTFCMQPTVDTFCMQPTVDTFYSHGAGINFVTLSPLMFAKIIFYCNCDRPVHVCNTWLYVTRGSFNALTCSSGSAIRIHFKIFSALHAASLAAV
jgi:hypothetical protein